MHPVNSENKHARSDNTEIDECHRSQFGENHKAIKEFFPNAQLFGFTGTPIFEANASAQQIEGQQTSYKTTADIFQQQLHAYTITHAIEDRNVLRFHVAYYKPEGNHPTPSGHPSRGGKLSRMGKMTKRAIVEAILAKHDAATNQRKFNAVLATASINDAIEYHALFKTVKEEKQAADPDFQPLSFRQQQEAVDTAIGLFSGQATKPAKEIWLVDKAPVVIEKLQTTVQQLDDFMQSHGLENKPEAVPNLKGGAARAQFINLFKEVQRLNTQLDQYTDLTEENKTAIEQVLPREQLQGFKGVYLDTAQRLKAQQGKGSDRTSPEVEQLDFEFVLFASAVIDYDYIMALIARYTSQTPGKQKMSREQLMGLIQADAKFMEDRDDIAEYINTLETGQALDEQAIRAEFERFQADKQARMLDELAGKHGLAADALQTFVDTILRRMVFDGDRLSDLFAPLKLGWKARARAELALMEDLIPLLKKLAQGREISGLEVYEQ